MQYTLALAALASTAYAAVGDAPASPPPAGCETSYDGPFQVTIQDLTSSTKRASKRQSSCGESGLLTTSLKDSILTDSNGSQGAIVENYQFQFDPVDLLQPNSVYTEGFSACSNGSLALGGSTVFYECPTFGGPGIGNYSNLYSQSTGAQCSPILINILPCGEADTATTAAVSQISDGQAQATATAPVSQISDGQIQVTTGVPVSQISDGQIQATTGAPVSQISDGQIQATSATGAPVSQISDGQIQATTATGAPVSQISDGQIQATSATGAPVSQISDGQIQATSATAPKNATSTYTPIQVTGAANHLAIGSGIVAIMVGGIAALL